MSVKESIQILNGNNLGDENPYKDNQFLFTGSSK